MKKLIIITLVCINLALIAAVTIGAKPQKAYAQRRGRGGNFTMVTARKTPNQDVIYVIDTDRRIMAAWLANSSRGSLQFMALRPRNLDRDAPVAGSR